jgi:hypothetical protein
MCLAASSAPVAVKRRAVERVNKVKILPVYMYMYVYSIVTIQKNASPYLSL